MRPKLNKNHTRCLDSHLAMRLPMLAFLLAIRIIPLRSKNDFAFVPDWQFQLILWADNMRRMDTCIRRRGTILNKELTLK